MLTSLGSNQSMKLTTVHSMHVYEVRPRHDHRGVDLISDALPFGRLWYGEPNAIDYVEHCSRSHDAIIRVYDAAGNVIETHEHKGEFGEVFLRRSVAFAPGRYLWLERRAAKPSMPPP